MDKKEAREILHDQVARLRTRSYEELRRYAQSFADADLAARDACNPI